MIKLNLENTENGMDWQPSCQSYSFFFLSKAEIIPALFKGDISWKSDFFRVYVL